MNTPHSDTDLLNIVGNMHYKTFRTKIRTRNLVIGFLENPENCKKEYINAIEVNIELLDEQIERLIFELKHDEDKILWHQICMLEYMQTELKKPQDTIQWESMGDNLRKILNFQKDPPRFTSNQDSVSCVPLLPDTITQTPNAIVTFIHTPEYQRITEQTAAIHKTASFLNTTIGELEEKFQNRHTMNTLYQIQIFKKIRNAVEDTGKTIAGDWLQDILPHLPDIPRGNIEQEKMIQLISFYQDIADHFEYILERDVCKANTLHVYINSLLYDRYRKYEEKKRNRDIGDQKLDIYASMICEYKLSHARKRELNAGIAVLESADYYPNKILRSNFPSVSSTYPSSITHADRENIRNFQREFVEPRRQAARCSSFLSKTKERK